MTCAGGRRFFRRLSLTVDRESRKRAKNGRSLKAVGANRAEWPYYPAYHTRLETENAPGRSGSVFNFCCAASIGAGDHHVFTFQ